MIPCTKINRMFPDKRISWLGFAVSFILLAFACAGKEELKEDSFFNEWKARAEKSKGYSPGSSESSPDDLHGVEKEVSEDQTEPLDEEKDAEPESRLPIQKVSMRMRNTDVGVILRALARNVGLNIMMTDQVKGLINIDVKETPWDQVFRSILSTGGFIYTWEGEILRVMTLQDIRTEKELLEANQNLTIKKKELDLKISSLNTKARMIEPLMTWIYHIKYADAETLREKLWEFFSSGYVSQYTGSREGASVFGAGVRAEEDFRSSKSVRGAILVDPHTNSLVIQAIRSD
ncbi:MAG: hypothetical protein SV775_10250, partial [Thermodesulfobacteriota bacterium]|nr:hypothetical protein [Thermodesulfobacteriota bacterium]